jgi:hypothetical protein
MTAKRPLFIFIPLDVGRTRVESSTLTGSSPPLGPAFLRQYKVISQIVISALSASFVRHEM